jgi:hypothetical protein
MFEEALEHFKEGLIEDVQGKARPIEKPNNDKDPNLLAIVPDR